MHRRPKNAGGSLEPLVGVDGRIFDWSPEYVRAERSYTTIIRWGLSKMDDTQGIWYTLAFDRQYCAFR